MANPFLIEPANALQALMAGTQGYDRAAKSTLDNEMRAGRLEAAQALQSGGDVRGSLAKLLGIGDVKGAEAIANYAHQQSQQGFQQQQLGQQAQQFGITSAEAARHNKATEGIAAAGQDKPIPLTYGGGLYDWKNQKTLVSPSSDGLLDPDTVTAMAHQLKAGDTSVLANLGRGAQGAQNVIAVRRKVAELNSAEGKTGADQANVNATYGGLKAGERTKGTREAGLDIILKATDAAIPAALEASDAVERHAGSFVQLNRIIQKGQVMTSDAKLRQFGMANLQLAEHWARAMNPTGVMRESDRDMALGFLSTADSKETYKQVVNQLKLQITRERDAIRSSHASGGPAATPAPAAPSAAAPAVQDWRTYFGTK